MRASKLFAKAVVKLARSRLSVPLRVVMRRARESYYNIEVLTRIQTKTAPLSLQVDVEEFERVNILIPEINFENFYGGYIAKFNLARKLVASGRRVRFVIVDQCNVDMPRWRDMVSTYEDLTGIFESVEVGYHFDRTVPLAVNPNDTFVATTWWTAFIADAALSHLNCDEFIYLIQEYEPFTFPMGSYFAQSHASYDLPHRGLYSTELLRDYFRRHNVGYNFGTTRDAEDQTASFENAIINYADEELTLSERRPGKLLFYSRPESHAARNMFEIGYQALATSIENGIFDGEWEFHGIGSSHGDIPLPCENNLTMLGKVDLDTYRSLLPQYDIGLSLMYTPHPSLLPIEMAAAGAIAVTNECLNKTQVELQSISGNILATTPTIDGVMKGLREAVVRAKDHDRRLANSRVNWATSWDMTFDHGVIDVLNGWIG
ncbi:MAG: hypothetical protein OEQ39_17710 [Gammaproteobacteria bacterium]|nr:hypothetical protein [Gammaproteobacteria bacterium]MDH3465601.1 hypothetical protein [Gammaproteobacteria bacterium]